MSTSSMVVHRSANRDDGREKRRFVPRCARAEDLRLARFLSYSGVVMMPPLKGLRERLLLQLVKLGLADGAAVEKLLSGLDLLGWVRDAHDRRRHVHVFLPASPSSKGLLTTFGHSPATGNHVDQDTQERCNDQENDPHRFPPAAEISVSEQIDEDLEQHDQIAAENEGPHQQPEEIRETVHSNLRWIRLSIA